ncbi:GIY-YIG nuclease family protein [Bdellovibrionota bacterium FG-1]
MKTFDRKFGKDFLASVPTNPGIYRVFSEEGALIYVGKAKNLRRRIGQYRNAKRRKKHLKMRKIVADSARIEFEVCPTELAACLLEARVIQDLRPRWNTAGAFYFLYPLIGIKREQGVTYFCFTTHPEAFSDFELHGAYRSRGITGGAFWALMDLLKWVGHKTPPNRKRVIPKYSYVMGYRQLPESWMPIWSAFFRGDSREAMELLVLALVENAGARRSSKKVQKSLNGLKMFWRHEASLLRNVRKTLNFETYPVGQKERDFLFLKRRYPASPSEEICVQ